jgi:tetratricopeptide (TPR) repeat protein
LVWAHDQLNQTTSAIAILERALELRPDDTELRLFAVQQYAEWGDVARAEQHLELARGPAAPATVARAAARLADRRGDSQAKLLHWQEVLAAEPMAMDAHREVARLLAIRSGKAAAIAHVSGAVRQFPYYLPLCQLGVWVARDESPAAAEPPLRSLLARDPSNAWAWRELASILLRLRRLPEAREALDAAEPLEPLATGLFNLRAGLLADEGRYAEARETLKATLSRDVDNPWAMGALMSHCQTASERRAAILYLRDELIRQTTRGDGLFEFADIARPNLDPSDLLDLFRQAHAARPDLWQAWSTLCRQLSAMNLRDEALSVARDATVRFPLIPRLWLDLGLVHRARVDHSSEIEAFEKVRTLSPAWGWAMRELSDAYINAGRASEAEPVLEEAVRRAPADAYNHGALGALKRQLGQNPAALECFKQAVLLSPDYHDAWSHLAAIGKELKQPGVARELAEQLTERRPAEPDSWHRLACQLDDPASLPKALEALDRALSLNPRHIPSHRQRASVLSKQGRWDEAFAACRPAIYAGQPPAELVAFEAYLRARRGDRKTAIQIMRSALGADRSIEWGWRRLAEWLHADDQIPEAVEAAEVVAQLTPGDVLPLGYLASLKLRNKDTAGAKEVLTRAFELDAGYWYAASNLFDIQLDEQDYDAARRTLSRLGPQIPASQKLALEIELALRTDSDSAIPGLLQRLCAFRDDGGMFNDILDRLRNHGRILMAEPVVRAAIAEPSAHPRAGGFWVSLAFEARAKGVLKTLREMGFDRELAVEAWVQWCDSMAEAVRKTRSQNALNRDHREYLFSWVLFRLGPGLQKSTRIWAEAGYFLVATGRYRKAARWMRGWRERDGVTPRMLFNLLRALSSVGRHREFQEVALRGAAILPRDDFSVRFELWSAIFAFLNKNSKPAMDLAAQMHVAGMDNYLSLLFRILRLCANYQPGATGAEFRAEEKKILEEFAASAKSSPVRRRVFRQLMAEISPRTQWRWTRLWGYWTLCRQFPGVLFVVAAGVAVGIPIAIQSPGGAVIFVVMVALITSLTSRMRR